MMKKLIHLNLFQMDIKSITLVHYSPLDLIYLSFSSFDAIKISSYMIYMSINMKYDE